MEEVAIEPQSYTPPEATPSNRSSSGNRMQQIKVQPDRRTSNKSQEYSDQLQGGFDWGKRGLIWSPPRSVVGGSFLNFSSQVYRRFEISDDAQAFSRIFYG
jgi:hypothetical protein